MNALKFRLIATDDERQLFAANFQSSKQNKRTGTGPVNEPMIPLAYLQASQVTGVYDSNNRLIAGYVIATAQPLRLLDFVPIEQRPTVISQHQEILANCCEVTCAWRVLEVSPSWMAARFWPHAYLNALKTGKRFFLGHNQHEGLDKLYTQAEPRTLYVGPSSYNLPSRLFVYTRLGLIWLSVLSLALETPKRILKQWRKRNKRSNHG